MGSPLETGSILSALAPCVSPMKKVRGQPSAKEKGGEEEREGGGGHHVGCGVVGQCRYGMV